MNDIVIERYSDTLPPEKQALIRRIQPVTDGTMFRTRICFPVDEGAADDTLENRPFMWYEARKNKESGLWSVAQYKSYDGFVPDDLDAHTAQDTNDDSNIMVSRTILDSGLCFFDALHACAAFEVSYSQADYDAIAARPSRQELGARHYRAFAADQGIIFHKKTLLPVPVVNGEILDDDITLSMKDTETIERAQDNLAAQEAVAKLMETSAFVPYTSGSGLTGGAGQALAKIDEVTGKRQNISKINQSYETQQKTLAKLSDHYDLLDKTKGRHVALFNGLDDYEKVFSAFYASTSSLIAGSLLLSPVLPQAPIFIGGIGGIALAMGGLWNVTDWCCGSMKSPLHIIKNTATYPQRRFKRSLKALYKEAVRWPEERPQHQATQWLAQQYDVAGHALTARHHFTQAAETGGWYAAQRSKRSLKKMEAVFARCATPQGEQDQILAGITNENLHSGFEMKMTYGVEDKTEQYQTLMTECQEQELASVKSLPKPS